MRLRTVCVQEDVRALVRPGLSLACVHRRRGPPLRAYLVCTVSDVGTVRVARHLQTSPFFVHRSI